MVIRPKKRAFIQVVIYALAYIIKYILTTCKVQSKQRKCEKMSEEFISLLYFRGQRHLKRSVLWGGINRAFLHPFYFEIYIFVKNINSNTMNFIWFWLCGMKQNCFFQICENWACAWVVFINYVYKILRVSDHTAEAFVVSLTFG